MAAVADGALGSEPIHRGRIVDENSFYQAIGEIDVAAPVEDRIVVGHGGIPHADVRPVGAPDDMFQARSVLAHPNVNKKFWRMGRKVGMMVA